MNQGWNPEFHFFERNASLVIQIDLTGLHWQGVEVTVNGNLLIVHRSPNDGPPDEVVFECPAGFDPARARAEAQSGLLHIEVPRLMDPKCSNLVEKEIARKKLKNWLAQELKAAGSHMNEIEESPWGRFSQN